MNTDARDRINIELGCPIFIEISNQKNKLSSRVIGVEHRDYLIVKTPTGAGAGTLKAGKIFVIKYVHQGIVYGFKTHVLTAITRPANVLFIGYPSKVDEQGLRSESRYKCSLKCVVKTIKYAGPGTLVDISMKGCCCSIRAREVDFIETLAVGAELKFELEGAGSDPQVKMRGTITNIIESEKSTRVGVLFKDVNDQAKRQLKVIMFPLSVI